MKKLKDGTIRYRINEFSNMTGIPPAVIRYYESQGYPFPRREANGYRTFQVEDAYRLNMFRSIHARGFSVGESIALMQDTPRQELQDRFGRLPRAAENLFVCAGIRIIGILANLDSISCADDKIILERAHEILKPDGKIPRLPSGTNPDSKLRFMKMLLEKIFLKK